VNFVDTCLEEKNSHIRSRVSARGHKKTHTHTNVSTQNIPWPLNDWSSIVLRHRRWSRTFPIYHTTDACHREMFRLHRPHVTENPCCITFTDSFHKQQLLKQSIELSLSSIILVQKPTQSETDITEISPGFRCDTTLCVYSVKRYGIQHNNYRT
jgi:hypothetical protein